MARKPNNNTTAPPRRSLWHCSEIDGPPPVPKDADAAWVMFQKFLKRKGARITLSRRFVLESVFSRHDHFRADELAEDLAGGKRRVSRGTVYRTLALLVEAGLVRVVRDEDQHLHYEHIYGHTPHDHMICEECGAFVEFSSPEVDEKLKKICEDNNFTRRAHRVTIFGLCRECAGDAASQE